MCADVVQRNTKLTVVRLDPEDECRLAWRGTWLVSREAVRWCPRPRNGDGGLKADVLASTTVWTQQE